MEDADTLELTFFIQIIEHNLVQDDEIALFPLVMTIRRCSKNVELSNQFDTELIAPGKKSSHIQNFAHVSGNSFVVSDKFLGAVESVSSYTGYLRTLKVIGVFQGNTRAKIADDLVPSFIVEMIGVFQELLSVHSELPHLTKFSHSFARTERNVKLMTSISCTGWNVTIMLFSVDRGQRLLWVGETLPLIGKHQDSAVSSMC
jgi:hypothetical protein